MSATSVTHCRGHDRHSIDNQARQDIPGVWKLGVGEMKNRVVSRGADEKDVTNVTWHSVAKG